LPTRLGWEHGVNDGLYYWEAMIQKPGWWSLRVELLRAAVIVPVVSTVCGATSRDLCASYGPHDARLNPGGLPDMIQHAMRVAEKAADYCARQYGIPEVRLVTKPLAPAVRAEPPATAVAVGIDELVDV